MPPFARIRIRIPRLLAACALLCGIACARAALVDMGPIASDDGRGARLWAQTADGDVCRPEALHVLVDVHAPLASEQVARQWLQAAYQHWRGRCGAAQRGIVSLQIHQGFALERGEGGNPTAPVVRATAALQGQQLLFQQYSNNTAAMQQQKAGEAEPQREYAANARRLRQLAQQWGATRVVDLRVLGEARGGLRRFAGQVLITGARTVRVLRTRGGNAAATVRAAHHDGGDFSLALAQGRDVARWASGDARMLAVRVVGRSTDVRTQDHVILQVLGSQACAASDCEDYLLLPGGQWAHDQALPPQ